MAAQDFDRARLRCQSSTLVSIPWEPTTFIFRGHTLPETNIAPETSKMTKILVHFFWVYICIYNKSFFDCYRQKATPKLFWVSMLGIGGGMLQGFQFSTVVFLLTKLPQARVSRPGSEVSNSFLASPWDRLV